MSLRVDLGLVRFSPIEDTYYFYDPQHPTAIQFLLNGKWESWDVGWVKHHAHDPEIKHVAADAEAHAIRYSSTYEQWRSTPMPRVAPVGQPFSPSLESDISRSRAPMDRPFSPKDTDSPLSPPISHGSNRDVLSLTAPNALFPLSQSGMAFSPAPNSPSASRPHPTFEGTQFSSNREDNHLIRPPIDSPPPSHDGITPAPASKSTLSSGTPLPDLAPGLPPIGHVPLASSVMPSSAAPTAVFRPPHLSAPPITAASLSITAPQTDAHNLRSSSTRHTSANHYPPTSEKTSDIVPQLQAIEAPCPPPGASSPQTVQPSQPPPLMPRKGRHYKIILSLDGDGIRGLSQVFLVEALVGAICTKVNQNVKPYQIFDLIGGSSMGAALGLMLSRLRMQAHTAREAYKFIAREVFQDKKTFFSSLDPHTASHLYDAQGVEDAIKTVVNGELLDADVRLYDPREDSADAFVITTQVKLGSNKAAVLRSYHTRRIAGPELDDNIFVWQAMKAAVLAPRYACPENGKTWRSVIEPGLVDYGTTKDNPVSDAYYECRKLYKYTGDRMVIVSIGTGSGLNPDCESAEMAKSVYKRNGDAEQQCFEFQRDHEGLIKSGWLEYFRFNVPNLDDTPLEEWCNEELIRKKTTAYLASPDVGWSFHRCVDNITAILTGV